MKAFLFQHVPFKPALKTTHYRFYGAHQHQRITSLHCCFLSIFSVAICISDLGEIARSIPFMLDFYFFLSFGFAIKSLVSSDIKAHILLQGLLFCQLTVSLISRITICHVAS